MSVNVEREDVAVSVLEDLRGVERRVVARLKELQPLIEEYEELRRAAERLGLDTRVAKRPRTSPARTTRAKKPSAAKKSSSSRRRPGGTKATGTERRARVLQLIEERPGISVPEISKELGLDPPPLYRVVRKLQGDGLVKKEGKNLRLA